MENDELKDRDEDERILLKRHFQGKQNVCEVFRTSTC